MKTTNEDLEKKLTYIYKQLSDFLVEKNLKYGNSAQEPLKVFSKTDAVSGILSRIDDKLSRIKNSSTLRKNDLIDLMGYLSLLAVTEPYFSEFFPIGDSE
jgi:hypothetical protein